jgi:hypothetical protein
MDRENVFKEDFIFNNKNKMGDKYMDYKYNFTDIVNVTKAKYIYNLTLEEFKFKFWKDSEVDENGRSYKLKTFYNLVRKFCGEVIRNKVEDKDYALINRKYRYSNGKNGRIFVNGFGVQSLQGNLRKFLTGDYLLDIDIKNCHPNILYKLVLEYNQNHEHQLEYYLLEKYCKQRNDVLDKEGFDKTQMLVCLNSDKISTNLRDKTGFYTKNKFLIDFHKEKMEIFKCLIRYTDYIKTYEIKSDNEINPISSKINKLFCIKENEIIQSVMKSDICVPMFDGFMFIRKDKEKYDYLLEEDGIIQWDYKENISDIEMTDFNEFDSQDYYTLKEWFEKTHCLIKAKPIVFLEKQKDNEGKLINKFYTEKDMAVILKNKIIVNDEGKKQKFFDAWLEDPKRKEYDDFAFNPYVTIDKDTTPKNIFNTFEPFEVDEIKDIDNEELEKEIQWFREFLFDVISDKHKETYEYLLDYLGDYFQRPFKNCQVALILRGPSGSGKDTLIDIIKAMIGVSNDYVYRGAKVEDILPKDGFNSQLKNKLLIQFNETEGKDGIDYKELIKDHITRAYNTINEKYVNPYNQKNLAPIIFCSNNTSPVQFMYDERRFVMVKTGQPKPKVFYNNIHENILKDKFKLNCLYTFFLRRDISEWDAQGDRPMTDAYISAVSSAIPHHIRFLREAFIDREPNKCGFDVLESNGKIKGYYMKAKELYNIYDSWAQDNHLLKYGQFKSQSFKKQMEDVTGIKFDVKYNGNRIVLFRKHLIIDYLKRFTFNTSDEDNELDLDDLSDDE